VNEKALENILVAFGITEKELEVYIFLTKHGALKGGEIARHLKKDKAQIFRILKSLQVKGLVESTLETPTRFMPVQLETVLDLIIKTKRDEADLIDTEREELISLWKNLSKATLKPSERFLVIEGSNKIYFKILQMVNGARKQFSAILTFPNLMRAHQFGIFDAIANHPFRTAVQFRFLTELSERNLNIIKALFKRIPKTGLYLNERDPDLGFRTVPQIVVTDEELLIFIAQKIGDFPKGQDNVCFWTNCNTLVQSFSTVFEELWRNSKNIKEKDVEIKTGKSMPRACILNDSEAAHKKLYEIVRSAKEYIIIMTSSKGLLKCLRSIHLIKERVQKGVSVRIMAPITSENLEAARQLMGCCEVKHAPVGYLETVVVDGKHLFQFSNSVPSLEKLETNLISRFINAFYTTDMGFVEKAEKMLNDVWKSACAPSLVTLESIISPFNGTLQRAVKKINGISLAEGGKPLSKLTEKDVLKKVMFARKCKGKAKGIVRFYGSVAQAIVHPSDSLNLPDILFHILHFEKHSAYGATDAMLIFLRLKIPTGHDYVGAALVIDNPKAIDYCRKNFKGLPFEKNLQLVKKDQIQIRMHGNTMFIGWTVPIKLLLPQYILPPSFIIIKGYGDVKTMKYCVNQPSGYTVVNELNGLEAFVTFFSTSPKYEGPGTEGFLARDMITTVYPPHVQIREHI